MLIEEIEELELRIKDQELRSDMIKQRLAEMGTQEKATRFMHPLLPNQYIMQGSILSVHVIDARELRGPSSRRLANGFVRLSIEGQSAKTQTV